MENTNNEERLRKSGIDILGEVPWGLHLCQFYRTKEEMLDILVPYFKAGLEANEFCMWVTSDPLTVRDAQEALGREVKDFDRFLNEGRIEILPHNEWYTKGGSFDVQRTLNNWVDKLSWAMAKGFDGARVTGNTTWIDEKDWAAFSKYESLIDGSIEKLKILVICTYSLERCSASDVFDLVSSHRYALINRTGKWDFIETSVHRATVEALKKSKNRLEKTVFERTHELSMANTALITEIQERKRVESALKESLDLLQVVMDNSRAAIFIRDYEGRYIMVNRWFESLVEAAPGSIIGRTPFDIFPKETASRLFEAGKRVIDTREPAELELDIPIKGDETHTYIINYFPILGLDGRQGAVCGISTDITERKHVETALRKSEASLANAQKIAHMGSWDWDLVKNEVHRSDEVLNIMGLSREEMGHSQDTFINMVHPDDRGKINEAISESVSSGKPFSIEYRIVRKDGTVRALHSEGEAVFSEGRAIRVTGVVQDITERMEHEERQARLTAIIEATTDFVATADTEGNTLYMNKGGKRMLGHDEKEDLKGLRIEDAHPAWAAKLIFQEGLQTAARDGVWSDETAFLSKDGREIPTSQVILSHKGDDGKVQYYSTIARDISDRKQAEAERARMQAQLLQSQKIETIGKLAGGIAHDFNNLVTIIGSYSALAMREPITGQAREYIQQIRSAAERGANFTRQLLIFSRNQPVKPGTIDLNVSVKEMLKILERVISENIELRNVLSEGLWPVRADKAHVEQLIMNLVINAKDALPDGGFISVTTENVTLDENACMTHPDARPGRFVRLSVADNGVGMDPDVRARVFEPFFSTKGVGKGMGLGLAVVSNVLKDLGGWITVESRLHGGSTFTVYIPAGWKALKNVEKGPSEAEQAGKGETVLIVEDEKVLRKSVALVLAKSGYTVLVAPNANEAIELFEREGGRIDILFSDMILSDMNGVELAGELLKRNPGLKVVLTSGYMDIQTQWPAIQEKAFRFLQKPYEVPELLNTIREAMDEKGPD